MVLTGCRLTAGIRIFLSVEFLLSGPLLPKLHALILKVVVAIDACAKQSIIYVDEVAIHSGLFFVFLVVLCVRINGDEVEVDRMRLRDFEFGFAFGTTQDLAFFDFVFIDIDFGGTFRATDHGSPLRIVVCKVGVRGPYLPLCSVLYTAAYEVNSRAWRHCFERHCIMDRRTLRMTSSREYPERPMVGIGGVIIDQGRTLLIRRGSEPLRGEWSIPGGTLELGETLEERSEEHTSELQSRLHLVCRLLLEKKKNPEQR